MKTKQAKRRRPEVVPADAAGFWAAADREQKALRRALKLRDELSTAEAELASTRDALWAAVDSAARSGIPCDARESARNVWLWWQNDHATRHGLPLANERPEW